MSIPVSFSLSLSFLVCVSDIGLSSVSGALSGKFLIELILIDEYSYICINAVCLGGEEAVLKTVGRKRLARSNRVYGVN